ncbi:MAG: HAMP domain-containing histidine kinase [Vicinamibacterales bacterium]|jgi:signal transduction histidine kinase|nr:HAMP domain-containing histidine kinase [Vicinamibacterales bacterium]
MAAGLASCPACGIDVALAAVLLERQALSVIPAGPGTPFVGDAMLSRFGEFLMKQGYITAAQLDAALGRQRELAGAGVRETLGQVLLEMRVMTREQLELASVEQVQELQSALRSANVRLEQRVADRTRELEQAYRKLTELDQLKGNFISNVSHELRTPLTKIKGFNALLASGDLGALTVEQQQAVEVMGRGVSELERLVGDLIQFATGARGEMVLRPAVMPVAEALERAVAALRDRAASADVMLACHPPGPGVCLMADPEKVRWVLDQLLDNAIKFTPAGGRIEAGAEPSGGRVRIWVTDTGPGIAEDRLPELFEPFHQLDGSATRRRGGTGLGLALVKMIAAAHQGTVSVETRPGAGSRFVVDLPAAP